MNYKSYNSLLFRISLRFNIIPISFFKHWLDISILLSTKKKPLPIYRQGFFVFRPNRACPGEGWKQKTRQTPQAAAGLFCFQTN
jgi:hypothetical protein